jgi:hypothetical protein
VQDLKLAAQFVMDSMMLTDVPLLFLPGQAGTHSIASEVFSDTVDTLYQS